MVFSWNVPWVESKKWWRRKRRHPCRLARVRAYFLVDDELPLLPVPLLPVVPLLPDPVPSPLILVPALPMPLDPDN